MSLRITIRTLNQESCLCEPCLCMRKCGRGRGRCGGDCGSVVQYKCGRCGAAAAAVPETVLELKQWSDLA